jgi:hypothetical protein
MCFSVPFAFVKVVFKHTVQSNRPTIRTSEFVKLADAGHVMLKYIQIMRPVAIDQHFACFWLGRGGMVAFRYPWVHQHQVLAL